MQTFTGPEALDALETALKELGVSDTEIATLLEALTVAWLGELNDLLKEITRAGNRDDAVNAVKALIARLRAKAKDLEEQSGQNRSSMKALSASKNGTRRLKP